MPPSWRGARAIQRAKLGLHPHASCQQHQRPCGGGSAARRRPGFPPALPQQTNSRQPGGGGGGGGAGGGAGRAARAAPANTQPPTRPPPPPPPPVCPCTLFFSEPADALQPPCLWARMPLCSMDRCHLLTDLLPPRPPWQAPLPPPRIPSPSTTTPCSPQFFDIRRPPPSAPFQQPAHPLYHPPTRPHAPATLVSVCLRGIRPSSCPGLPLLVSLIRPH